MCAAYISLVPAHFPPFGIRRFWYPKPASCIIPLVRLWTPCHCCSPRDSRTLRWKICCICCKIWYKHFARWFLQTPPSREVRSYLSIIFHVCYMSNSLLRVSQDFKNISPFHCHFVNSVQIDSLCSFLKRHTDTTFFQNQFRPPIINNSQWLSEDPLSYITSESRHYALKSTGMHCM